MGAYERELREKLEHTKRMIAELQETEYITELTVQRIVEEVLEGIIHRAEASIQLPDPES